MDRYLRIYRTKWIRDRTHEYSVLDKVFPFFSHCDQFQWWVCSSTINKIWNRMTLTFCRWRCQCQPDGLWRVRVSRFLMLTFLQFCMDALSTWRNHFYAMLNIALGRWLMHQSHQSRNVNLLNRPSWWINCNWYFQQQQKIRNNDFLREKWMLGQ